MEFVIFVNTKLFCQEESYQQDNLYYSQKFMSGAQKKIYEKVHQFSSLIPGEIKQQEITPISIINFKDEDSNDKSQVFDNKENQSFRQNIPQPLLNANNMLQSKFKNLMEQTTQFEKEIKRYEFLRIFIDNETYIQNQELCLNIYNYAYKQHWIDQTLGFVEQLGGQQRLFIFILNKLKVIVIQELITILHGQTSVSLKKLFNQQQQLLEQEKDNLENNLELLNKEKQYWQQDLQDIYSKISNHIDTKEKSFEDVRILYRFALAHLYKQCVKTMDQTQTVDGFIKLRLYLLGCMLLNSLFTTYRKITFQEFNIDDVSEIENFIQTKEIAEISKLIDHIQKLHFSKWK
ncbi:hypothetical protein pb186bvf_009275 [Paramecium bursaria]